MTDQEKAKAILNTTQLMPADPARYICDLLAPIAAGTHQIVPKEPTEKMKAAKAHYEEALKKF
jgi:hypothetical protein